MTHLEQYKAFLDAAGVEHAVEKKDGLTFITVGDWPGLDENAVIVVPKLDVPKVAWKGYNGFFFYFTFDSAGKLLNVGAGE